MVAALASNVARCENEIKVLTKHIKETESKPSGDEPIAAETITFSSVVKKKPTKPQAPKQPPLAPKAAPPAALPRRNPPNTAAIPTFTRPPPVKRTLQPNPNPPAVTQVTIAAAKKMNQLYIGKVGPNVTEQDLLTYLEGKGITGDATAHLLYAGAESRSFRVCVEEAVGETVIDSSFWPNGLTVRPFLARNPRRRQGETYKNPELERRGTENGSFNPPTRTSQ